MSAFTAFRSAAVSAVRTRRTQCLRASTRYCQVLGTAAFHTSPVVFKKEAFDPASVQRKKIIIPEHNPTPKPRRGRKIPFPYVQILDTRTSTLGPVRQLEEILESVNEDEFMVELVSETPPTVKLIDLREARATTLLERQKAKRGTVHKDMNKEMQLTWTMAESDEAHKLSKVREDLEKGYRVDLVYTAKKGTKAPPRIEMQFKLNEAAQKLEGVSKEWKPHLIDKRMGVVYLAPTVKAGAKPTKEELKNSVPKSVIERQQRTEKKAKKQDDDEFENA